MRWNRLTRPHSYYHEWHDWFAWCPILLDNQEWIWLETVQRKCEGEMLRRWVYLTKPRSLRGAMIRLRSHTHMKLATKTKLGIAAIIAVGILSLAVAFIAIFIIVYAFMLIIN